MQESGEEEFHDMKINEYSQVVAKILVHQK